MKTRSQLEGPSGKVCGRIERRGQHAQIHRGSRQAAGHAAAGVSGRLMDELGLRPWSSAAYSPPPTPLCAVEAPPMRLDASPDANALLLGESMLDDPIFRVFPNRDD